MSSIVVLVGNPQPVSRTRLVAEELAGQLASRSGAHIEPTIDLADVADQLFRFPSVEVDDLLARVARADVVIVASPTYKASYTGLLKAFLDRYPTNGLAAVTAIPLLTIGSPAHTLAVRTHPAPAAGGARRIRPDPRNRLRGIRHRRTGSDRLRVARRRRAPSGRCAREPLIRRSATSPAARPSGCDPPRRAGSRRATIGSTSR